VFSVLVLVQHIAVQQNPVYVLVVVVFVLVLIQNITVQEVMVFVQIQFLHVTVQAVAQYGIVRHALTLMAYADIRHVAVILAATRMIMVYIAHIMGIITVPQIIIVVVDPVCVLAPQVLVLRMEKIIIAMGQRMR